LVINYFKPQFWYQINSLSGIKKLFGCAFGPWFVGMILKKWSTSNNSMDREAWEEAQH
jgi:hypothetical protein